MGTFRFVAEPAWDQSNCALSGAPQAEFEFTGTFSRYHGDSEAWLTIDGTWRPATFDGQYIRSMRAAPRRFGECACAEGSVDEVVLEETLSVALVSKSQDEKLGSSGCPDDALDGGIPAVDADAGVLAPGSTPRGFDAVRACGELLDVAVPDPAVHCCERCTLVYRVKGERK